MRMRCPVVTLLLATLQVAGLGACDKIRSTTIATTTVSTIDDGIRRDKNWSRTWRDRAEFRCIASSNGHCHVVVFTRECSGGECSTRVLDELTLPAGASRKLHDLPRGFRHCIAHAAKPVAPTCLKA